MGEEDVKSSSSRILKEGPLHFNSSLMPQRIMWRFLLLSVGIPVANAPDVAYCTILDVPTLTTSRLPKKSWQSEVELNLRLFRRSNFHH